MREDTRKRLERALWIDRAKKAGIGLAIVAAIATLFGFESLDLIETKTPVAGVIESIDPLVAKSVDAADTVNVGVRLDDGQHVRVIEMKTRQPHIGDRIQIVEHRHATGRVTHTLK